MSTQKNPKVNIPPISPKARALLVRDYLELRDYMRAASKPKGSKHEVQVRG